jgi:hypothetical protein
MKWNAEGIHIQLFRPVTLTLTLQVATTPEGMGVGGSNIGLVKHGRSSNLRR